MSFLGGAAASILPAIAADVAVKVQRVMTQPDYYLQKTVGRIVTWGLIVAPIFYFHGRVLEDKGAKPIHLIGHLGEFFDVIPAMDLSGVVDTGGSASDDKVYSDKAPVMSAIGVMVRTGLSKQQIITGIAIILAESGGNPKAKNINKDGSVDLGLWQINDIHSANCDNQCRLDPLQSTQYAMRLYQQSGWQPWVAYKTGRYKEFMDRARKLYNQYWQQNKGGQR